MKRETIEISDLANEEEEDLNHLEDTDGIEIIEDIESGFDAEKGFINHEVVFKRLTDGKFFKVEYTEFGYNGTDLIEQTAIEVFPEIITKVIYK